MRNGTSRCVTIPSLDNRTRRPRRMFYREYNCSSAKVSRGTAVESTRRRAARAGRAHVWLMAHLGHVRATNGVGVTL